MTQSPHEILEHPYVTEKVMTQMEQENALDFVVAGGATKRAIKWAFEEMFNVEVTNVTTRWSMDNEKHAVITLHPDYSAEEIAMEIGVF